jgi:hypothetical protein
MKGFWLLRRDEDFSGKVVELVVAACLVGIAGTVEVRLSTFLF